ncbi:hypothetical protein [Vibrio phage R01]|nr:hypothetical protein [Vibrio phage R01]
MKSRTIDIFPARLGLPGQLNKALKKAGLSVVILDKSPRGTVASHGDQNFVCYRVDFKSVSKCGDGSDTRPASMAFTHNTKTRRVTLTEIDYL